MLEVIKRTGVFLIIAETMYQFVQENRYARYVRLLIRLMTLAILILPVCDLFREESSALFYERLHYMEDEFAAYTGEQKDGQDVVETLSGADTGQEVRAYAAAQIRENCEACAGQNGYDIAELEIRDNGLCFYLRKAGTEETNGILVEQVCVQQIGEQGETAQDSGYTTRSEAALYMKKQFAQCLGVSEDLIEVSVDEGMEG